MRESMRLDLAFFERGAVALGRALLGQRLVRVMESGERLSGIIIETEAYVGVEDRASHAFGGRRTARNEPMYGRAGTAYVYFTYGMHFCFNIVCGEVDEPAAVLVRALEPSEGMDVMRGLRGSAARTERDLCSGPAKVCRALGIGGEMSGLDLVKDGRLFLERGDEVGRGRVVACPRIGIDRAGEWVGKPLRFVVKGHPGVSVRPPDGNRGKGVA